MEAHWKHLSFLQHTECIWTILAPAGERIHMEVDRLDVKRSSRCRVAQLSPSHLVSCSTLTSFSCCFGQLTLFHNTIFAHILKVFSGWPWAEEWGHFKQSTARLLAHQPNRCLNEKTNLTMILPFQATSVVIHPIPKKAPTMFSMSGKNWGLSLVSRSVLSQKKGKGYLIC